MNLTALGEARQKEKNTLDPANLSSVHGQTESADAMHPQGGQQNEDLLNVLIDINSNKSLPLIC